MKHRRTAPHRPAAASSIHTVLSIKKITIFSIIYDWFSFKLLLVHLLYFTIELRLTAYSATAASVRRLVVRSFLFYDRQHRHDEILYKFPIETTSCVSLARVYLYLSWNVEIARANCYFTRKNHFWSGLWVYRDLTDEYKRSDLSQNTKRTASNSNSKKPQLKRARRRLSDLLYLHFII